MFIIDKQDKELYQAILQKVFVHVITNASIREFNTI